MSTYAPPPAGQPTDPPGAYQTPPGVPNAASPYPQPGYAAPMPPQRNTLMFVVSIFLIVFGAIDLLVGLLALVGLSQVNATASVTLSVVFTLLSGVVLLVGGVMGVRNASNPSQGDMLFKIGIGMCGVALITIILNIVGGGSIFSGIGSLLLPALYTYAATQLKAQAPKA